MKDRFKHKLKNVKVDWDKETFWDEMEPKLPRKKSNGYWKGLTLLLLLLISTCWYVQRQEVAVGNEGNNSNQQTDFAGTGDQQNEMAPLDSTAMAASQVKKSAPENSQNAKIELAIKEQPENKNGINNSVVKQNNTDRIVSEEFLELPKSDSGLKTDFSSDEPSLVVESKAISQTPSTHILSNTLTQTASTFDLQSPLLLLESQDPFALNYQRPAEFFALKRNPRFKKEENKAAFYVGLAGLVGQPYRIIDASVYTGDERTFILNNASFEKPLINLSLQLDVAYQFKNNLRLETGVRGEQFYELLERENLRTDTFYVEDEKAYFQLVQEDTVFIAGEVMAIQKNGSSIIHNNRINSLSIPLNVGYTKHFGKFQLQAKAGISLYIINKYSGKQFDLEEGFVDEANFSISQPLGFQAQLGGGYPIGRRLQVMANAGFRQSAKFSFSEVGKTYRSVTIGLGIEARLGKI